LRSVHMKMRVIYSRKLDDVLVQLSGKGWIVFAFSWSARSLAIFSFFKVREMLCSNS
jgi:hypothetical protein